MPTQPSWICRCSLGAGPVAHACGSQLRRPDWPGHRARPRLDTSQSPSVNWGPRPARAAPRYAGKIPQSVCEPTIPCTGTPAAPCCSCPVHSHRHTILIRLTQYPRNLFATESSLLHSRLILRRRPFSQASIGSKFSTQVKITKLLYASELNRLLKNKTHKF